MPKINKPSAFISFVQEWRKLQGHNLRLEECIQLASPVWQRRSPIERQPYHDAVRQFRQSKISNEQLSMNIGPEQQQQQQRRNMHIQTEKLVQNSVQQAELETKNYCFLMINYFTRNIYAPAELTAAQFNLKEGMHDIYHTLINPGCSVYGSLHETREHAQATHQLPLPPNALGNDDLEGIQADLLKFVRSENGVQDELPPVFTQEDQIPVVSQALKFLNGGVASQLNVYPIEYLFFILKEATCEAGMLPPPKSMHITNCQFKLDPHEFLSEISCEFHKKRDLAHHCTKSYVTRWSYAFASYMCSDLAIKMLPNRHMPGDPGDTANMYKADPSAEKTDVPYIKIEPSIEDHLNTDALDALNNLDLDNIFEDDDILGLGKTTVDHTNWERYSGDSGIIIKEYEEVTSDEDRDFIIEPPPPPSISEDLKKDCDIYTRRPKREPNDCEWQKQNALQPTNQLSVEELSLRPKDRSIVNKRITDHRQNSRPLQNTKSNTIDRVEDEKSVSSNRKIRHHRRLSSERESERNRSHRADRHLLSRSSSKSPNRWRSGSRSSLKSKSRDNRYSRRISPRAKISRSRSRSRNRKLSSARRLRDRSVLRDKSVLRENSKHRSVSRSPRRVKYDRELNMIERENCRRRYELASFRDRTGRVARRSPPVRQHTISPLRSSTHKSSSSSSRYSNRKSRSPTISHKSDFNDFNKTRYSRDISPNISSRCSSQRSRFTSDISKETLHHQKSEYDNKKDQMKPVLINQPSEKSQIVENAKSGAGLRTPPRSILPIVTGHYNRKVVENSPHKIPTYISSHPRHVPYSTYHYGSIMTYDQWPPPGLPHYPRDPIDYEERPYELPNYDLRHRLEMTKFNHLSQNDLRYRIQGRCESSTELITYSREQYTAYQYHLSCWGTQNLTWCNEYGNNTYY